MKATLPNGTIVEDVNADGLKVLLGFGAKSPSEPKQIVTRKTRTHKRSKGRMYPYIKINPTQSRCIPCGAIQGITATPKHFQRTHPEIYQEAQGMKNIKKAKKASNASMENEESSIPTPVLS